MPDDVVTHSSPTSHAVDTITRGYKYDIIVSYQIKSSQATKNGLFSPIDDGCIYKSKLSVCQQQHQENWSVYKSTLPVKVQRACNMYTNISHLVERTQCNQPTAAQPGANRKNGSKLLINSNTVWLTTTTTTPTIHTRSSKQKFSVQRCF